MAGVVGPGGLPKPDDLKDLRGSFRKNPGRRKAAADEGEGEKKPRKPRLVMRDFVAVAEAYIDGVLDGRILACKWVKLACKRHREDRRREREDPGYPYRFDAGVANLFCARMERFPHIKGKWAAKGQKLRLEPWMAFIWTAAFGWLKKLDGKRRFTEIYIRVPRKNGKSTQAAAVGNTLLLDDGEHGAEVYAGATSEKQAWEVFGPAREMMIRSPEIADHYGVEVAAKALVVYRDRSKFWPIIGKPGDGMSPSCAIIDEYHEHDSSDQIDTMQTGMMSREQPITLIITTAGTNLASPCYEKDKEVQKVLEGSIPNEALFGIIYGIDEGQGKPGDPDYEAPDDWADPRSLEKANPNYGVSADPEKLLAQQRQAVLNPAYQNRFKTKHLNVWCGSKSAGINMHSWNLRADPGMTEADFIGKRCWGSLDLASKSDLAAYAKLFCRMINGERHYYAFVRHYLPADTIDEVKVNQAAYRKWMAMDRLIVHDGAEVDFELLREDVKADSARYQFVEVVYDPWRAAQLAQELKKDGATVVEIGQTARNMGSAFDELTSAIKAGRFHHDGCPVLTWEASNVLAVQVAKGLVVPGKDKKVSHLKIDGIVAIVMAISRAMVAEIDGGIEDWMKNTVTA